MIEQLAIALLGVSAVFLSQHYNEYWRRWSPVLGLCAQPFWFYATRQAGQWGIFALSFIYAGSWAFGFYTFWLRPRA